MSSGIFFHYISLLLTSLRPLYKYLYHQVTGQSEIQRIITKRNHDNSDNTKSRMIQLIQLSDSLKQSKQLKNFLFLVFGGTRFNSTSKSNQFIGPKLLIKTQTELDTQTQIFVTEICKIKKIDFEQKSVASTLGPLTKDILSINHLSHIIYSNAIPYDQSNNEHEKLLEQLWTLYKTDIRRKSRITKEWEELGFQGENPATDFRGMGVFGLMQLLYFVQNHRNSALDLLNRSQLGGLQYYSFAITGINITNDIAELTRDRKLDNYYYTYGATLEAVNQLYVTMFIRLDELWVDEDPDSVMEYNRIHKLFVQNIQESLKKFPVDDGYLAPIQKQITN